MRLSDAILLGDSLRRREGMTYLGKDNEGGYCGCAIGGALLASGYDSSDVMYKVWPWLTNENRYYSDAVGWKWTNELEISSQFLKVTRGEQTIEQLVDYVRSIEPDEPVQKMDETPTLQLQEVTQ